MHKKRKASPYKVGYGKPPQETRFEKGRSGNPKGRPKGHRNFKTDVTEALNAPVTINENGKRKNVTSQRAALMRLREKALKGDARSLDRLLDLARTYNSDEASGDVTEILTAKDEAIIENFAERYRKRARPEAGITPEGDKDDG